MIAYDANDAMCWKKPGMRRLTAYGQVVGENTSNGVDSSSKSTRVRRKYVDRCLNAGVKKNEK